MPKVFGEEGRTVFIDFDNRPEFQITRNTDFRNWSVSVSRCGEGDPYSVGSLTKELTLITGPLLA
jgi:hypothetical protein